MLADPTDDVLMLADGTKINTATGSVIKEKKYSAFVEVPSGTEAQAIVAKSRRSVAELPFAPGQMNVVSLVLFYSMWGLGTADIALSLGISNQQVDNIKALPQYVQLSDDIKKSVLEHEANDVRSMMQRHATGAAKKIVDLMEEEGALGFAAAKDVLDRAGHRPADVIEHRHKMEDTLRIEIVEKKADNDIPFIDVTPKVIEHGNST